MAYCVARALAKTAAATDRSQQPLLFHPYNRGDFRAHRKGSYAGGPVTQITTYTVAQVSMTPGPRPTLQLVDIRDPRELEPEAH
jgi:hypothetical protein